MFWGKNEQKQPSPFFAKSEHSLIEELLVNEAIKQGWIKERELKFIPELLPIQNNATDYFSNLTFNELSANPELLTTFSFRISRYLFSKCIEGVIKWGHSKDGKIDIYYHSKHLVEDSKIEFEIPPSIKSYPIDGLNKGEMLFNRYNEYILNAIKKGERIDLHSATKDLFKWVQKIGIHYSLENSYHKLWQ